ncbi:hypothetical protein, partial [Couchioplanes caeruleus]
ANSQIEVDLSGANVKAIADSLTRTTTIDSGDLPAMGDVLEFTDGTNNASVTFAAAPADVAATVTALNLDSDFTANFIATEDANGDLAITSRSGKEVTGGTSTVPDATFGITGGAATTFTGLSFTDATESQSAITDLDAKISQVS